MYPPSLQTRYAAPRRPIDGGPGPEGDVWTADQVFRGGGERPRHRTRAGSRDWTRVSYDVIISNKYKPC